MTLRLHYLPVRARAEPLRMMLRFANIPFVDHIIPFAAWPEWKEKMPPGKNGQRQVPVLELEDGTMMPESADIAHYIATRAGAPLLPEGDAGEAAQVWALLDATDAPFCSESLPTLGLVNPLLNWFPQEEAEPRIQPFLSAAPEVFKHFATILQKRPGAFAGGSKPHYGDFALFHFSHNLSSLDGGAVLAALDGQVGEDTRAWYKAMLEEPAVADYLHKRPQPGSGFVGRPGSIVFKHAVPAQRHAASSAAGKHRITLHEFGTTRSARCRWALLECGLPFAAVSTKPHSPEVLKLNPSGKLPIAEIDGKVLTESAAICAFVADLAVESGGPRLVARPGSLERAQHDQWVSFALAELDAWKWHSFTMEQKLPEADRSAAVLEHNAQMWRAAAGTLEAHLSQHDYLVASTFTCADIIVGWSVNWGHRAGLLDGFPATLAYLERLFARPHCALAKE